MQPSLLQVNDLWTEFAPARQPIVHAVRGVSLSVSKGETLGIVGESGSGKSVTALSIARLIDAPGRIARGQVLLDGTDLLKLSEKEMRSVRGGRVAFVFQDPMTALNPVLTIGQQMVETIKAHQSVSGKIARDQTLEWLERVHIALPERRLRQYPYELSGGMRQRVMIAMAFSCRPELLIADEPTTALDVTVQAQILNVMDELRAQVGTAVLLITHDLSVVAERCDRVIVMYAGQVVEEASGAALFASPKHPYTQALLESLPDVWRKQEGTEPLPFLPGQPPRLTAKQIPSGCAFHDRCPKVFTRCSVDAPPLYPVEQEQTARCLLYDRSTLSNEPPKT